MKSCCELLVFCLCQLMLSASSADFGEFCNETVVCNENIFLECEFSSCNCARASHLVYDPAKLSCVLKEGELCELESGDAHPTCASNAVCSYICSCAKGFYAVSNGLCKRRRKPFSVGCMYNHECQWDEEFLTCVNGKCGCEHTKTYIATEDRSVVAERDVEDSDGYAIGLVRNETWTTVTLNQCVGLAAQPCNPLGNCVNNSVCTSRTCSCLTGFREKSSGQCGATKGQRCSSVIPCADGLSCTNGICDCPQQMNQYYEPAYNKCIGHVHAFCSENTDCDPNGECVFNWYSGRKQCACFDGFIENSSRRCVGTVGTSCLYNSDICVDALSCKDGMCDCADSSTVFDLNFRMCLGRAGARCDHLDVPLGLGPIKGWGCVNGALCLKHPTGLSSYCACQPGWTSTLDGFCRPVNHVCVTSV